MPHKDKYRNYAELSHYEREDKDYQITVVDRGSDVTVMAPHGGKIEFRTSEIARAVVGDMHNLYLFEGKKENCNFATLHITSHRFDEPKCLRLVGRSRHVIAIHGARGEGKEILLGGLDTNLKRLIASELREVGFAVLEDGHDFPGKDEGNICNRGIDGGGVQIELRRGLRDTLDVQPFAEATRRAVEKATSDRDAA